MYSLTSERASAASLNRFSFGYIPWAFACPILLVSMLKRRIKYNLVHYSSCGSQNRSILLSLRFINNFFVLNTYN